MGTDWIDYALFAVVAALAACLISMKTRRRFGVDTSVSVDGEHTDPVFLFAGKTLRDATQDAMTLIAPHIDHMGAYEAMIHVFGRYFVDLHDVLDHPFDGTRRLTGPDGLSMEINRDKDQLRIVIHGAQSPDVTHPADLAAHDLRLSELTMLRDLTQHTPQLIWQEDLSGRLIWANHAYLAFCDTLREERPDQAATWPNRPILPDLHEASFGAKPTTRRVSVPLPDKQAEQWFDVTSMRRGDHLLHFANDANTIVRADQERHKFVQTMTMTFAQLSIGLAIFDRRRQLTTFNPALLDMTNLPIDFLSARPTVDAVLDRLRESRMLPEPKNYTTWREQFTALERAAKNGNYSETWNLPDGQTYRVTGRPHPDGAIAFLFEDISAEMSLTRRFRSDIETAQAVFDTLPEPIAVFSSAGTMVMSNKAYADTWGPVAEDSIAPHELQSAIHIWQDRCTPTPMWADLRAFVHMVGPRKPWSDSAIMDNGRRIDCAAHPITGGMTMVKFTLAAQSSPVIRKLTRPDQSMAIAKR
ncbi:PAS-domain containing protein [Yoonia sp. 2307UL14-13]|uniref:PAS-domain containing protein n=1 Tax=Yoonia sp. 2307UL14-13 TaxID=3126506 RepID=UPI0030B64DBE